MQRSPFYLFSNLAVAIPEVSNNFSYNNLGNPVVVASSEFTMVLCHVEEETEDDKEIPRGLRELFNYGVDAFLMRGYITENKGEPRLLDNILFFQEYPSLYRPNFFNKNFAQIGIVQFHKKLQTAFNENAITGDSVQLTFSPKEVPNNTDLYIQLSDRLLNL